MTDNFLGTPSTALAFSCFRTFCLLFQTTNNGEEILLLIKFSKFQYPYLAILCKLSTVMYSGTVLNQ